MMNFIWPIALLSLWLLSNVEAGKKPKKVKCLSNGDLNDFKDDINTEIEALKNDVSELKQAYTGDKGIRNELKELKKDVNDMKEAIMRGMKELLNCVKTGKCQMLLESDMGQVMWGDWGDWSTCDENLCNIVHRERLCLGEGGKVLDLSECSKLGGEHIQSRPCCKELQGIDKKKFYKDIYKRSNDPLPKVFVKATGSNIKIYEREKLSWVVSLKFMKTLPNGIWKHVCGGVILSNIWVATAAHCICDKYTACCDKENKVICKMNQWKVTAGEWRLGSTSKTEQNRDVEHIVVHQMFSHKEGYKMDIALIKLSSGLEFMNNPFVQPSLLPARVCRRSNGGKCVETHKDWAERTDCFTTGWGVGDDGEVYDRGQTVKVRIEDYVSQPSLIGSERIRGEKIVCMGYSGSPLMCNINVTAMEFIPPQNKVVLGLNSLIYPTGCDKEAKNYTQTYIVYHLEWISNTVMDWIQWGPWSKCSKNNKRHRLRSGFFPEYGYLPGDGPLYQNYNGDRFKVEEASCEDSTTSTTVTPTPTKASTTTSPAPTKASTTTSAAPTKASTMTSAAPTPNLHPMFGEDPLAPYSVRRGNCHGNDIAAVKGTLQECAKLCTLDGQCAGFVYTTNPKLNEECWLKLRTCDNPIVSSRPDTLVYDKELVFIDENFFN